MNGTRFFSSPGRFLGLVGLATALCATPAAAATITFDLTGANDQGSTGNTRVYTSGGVTVTATAWSYLTTFQPGALGRWSVGLGVCDQQELNSGGCVSPEHEVDNSVYTNYVLFQFSTAVDPLSMKITTTSDDDLDASYWTGTLTLPADKLAGDTLAILSGRGFGLRKDDEYSGSADFRTVTLNSGFVNGLLFGAQVGSSNDAFKLTTLILNSPDAATVPEPASLLIFGLGALGLAPRLRRRVA